MGHALYVSPSATARIVPCLMIMRLVIFALLMAGSSGCGGGQEVGDLVDLGTRPVAPDPAGWRATQSLAVARFGHTATLLADGRVLVVGGESNGGQHLAAVELYDPSSEQWTRLSDLPAPRSNHGAARLPDGRVLLFGGGRSSPIGIPSGEDVLASSLLFDPATTTFSEGPPMLAPRSHFRSLTLRDGSVLVVGGGNDQQEQLMSCGNGSFCGPFAHAVETVERYDPTTASFTAVGPMITGRLAFALVPLPDGGALAIGGVDAQAHGFRSTERFEVNTRTWSNGPDLLGPRRIFHGAALTGAGTPLVVGGKNPNVNTLDSAQRLDLASGVWTSVPKLSSPRTVPSLITLESGRVLMTGGYNQLAAADASPLIAESAIYDETTNSWTVIGPLVTGRVYQTMTRLADGRVLVVGGLGETGELDGCELTQSL